MDLKVTLGRQGSVLANWATFNLNRMSEKNIRISSMQYLIPLNSCYSVDYSVQICVSFNQCSY